MTADAFQQRRTKMRKILLILAMAAGLAVPSVVPVCAQSICQTRCSTIGGTTTCNTVCY
jgi:hypothetical protein